MWVNEGAPGKEVNFTAQPRCHTNRHCPGTSACIPILLPPKPVNPLAWSFQKTVASPQPCADGHLVARVKWSGLVYLFIYCLHLICEPALCLITKHTIISCANSWQMGTGLWTQSIQLTRLYNPKWGTLDFGGAKFAA